MKKIILLTAVLLLAAGLQAAAKKTPAPAALTPEQEADAAYDARNAVTDTAGAAAAADLCIEKYKKAAETAPSDELIYKYVRAVDFKNYNLVKDDDARKQAYKDMLDIVDKYCAGNTNCASSHYIAYCYMTLWGRYGDIINVMEAATSGIAGKVKDNAEKLYAIEKPFKDYAACLALGRLHWKAPNIPIIMTWPDKNLSKKYLEEYAAEYNAENPDALIGKFFLADTLWDTGDKEKAAALYKEVMNTPARKDCYWEDVKAKEICGARMKEQGIQ